jgi:hypothetical protein
MTRNSTRQRTHRIQNKIWMYTNREEEEEKHEYEYESTTLQRMEIEDTRPHEHTTHVCTQARIGRVYHQSCSPSYLTAHFIIQRRLLDYDREIHMMPLVSTYAIQSVLPSRGHIWGYDFHGIESALVEAWFVWLPFSRMQLRL